MASDAVVAPEETEVAAASSPTAAVLAPPSLSASAYYKALMESWWEQAKAQWQTASLPALNLSLATASITSTEWILIGVIIVLSLMVLFLAYIVGQKNKIIARMHLGSARYKTLTEYSKYLD